MKKNKNKNKIIHFPDFLNFNDKGLGIIPDSACLGIT
jgi:hypothetical protein